jgi:hypothetical protein
VRFIYFVGLTSHLFYCSSPLFSFCSHGLCFFFIAHGFSQICDMHVVLASILGGDIRAFLSSFMAPSYFPPFFSSSSICYFHLIAGCAPFLCSPFLPRRLRPTSCASARIA